MNDKYSPVPSGSASDHLAIIDRVMAETGAVKPAEIVWAALREAVGIVDKLPDRERGWLSSGRHSNFRSDGTTLREADATARNRTLAGLMAGDEMRPDRSARNAEAALLTLEWLRWLQGHRHADRLEAAALIILRGDDAQIAARIFKPARNLTRSRQTTYEIRQIATGLIVDGLRRQFEIDLRAGIGITAEAA